jgi:hypothetical protein
MHDSKLRARERPGLWVIVTMSLVPLVPCASTG